MKSIGIDIGSYSIKLVEVESLIPSGFRVSMLEEFPLNQDPTKDKSIEVVEILRQFILNRFDLGQNCFVLPLQKEDYIYRSLSFPFKQKYKILKALPFTLEDEIPFNRNEILYEVKLVSLQGNESKIMAFIAGKKSIQKLLEFAKKFHVDPNVVSAGEIALLNVYEKRKNVIRNPSLSSSINLRSILSLVRQSLSLKKRKASKEGLKTQEVEESNEEEKRNEKDEIIAETDLKDENGQKKRVRILLHLGHKKSFFLIIQGGHILVFKNLNWGGEWIIQALSKKQGLSFHSALQELQDNGFILKNLKGATPEQVETSDVIKDHLGSFLNKLYIELLQFKEEFQIEYSEMSLSGGISRIRNIESEFEKYLKIPTFRASESVLFQSLNVSPGLEFNASFLIALGLSIEGLKKSRSPPLNFLKGEFERKDQYLQGVLKKWSKVAQVSLALIFVLFVYSYSRNRLTSKISEDSYSLMREKASKITSIKGSNITIENINRFIKKEEKKNKSKELIEQLAELSSPLDFLNEFSKSLPPRKNFSLNIEGFTFDQSKVRIKGNASNEKTVNQLEAILKRMSKNEKVKKTTEVLKKKVGTKAVEENRKEAKQDQKISSFAFTMEFEVSQRRKYKNLKAKK